MGGPRVPDVAPLLLRAALGFLQLEPRASVLQHLHPVARQMDRRLAITVGVERRGMRLSLSHVADGEWRVMSMGDPMISARGFGVAPAP